MRESEQRYRALAESAQDFIFTIDKEGCVQYVNKFSADEFGVDADGMIGKPMVELFPPDTSTVQWEDIQKVFQSGHLLKDIEHITKFPQRDLWLNTSLIPLKCDNGEVKEVRGISRDMTEH